MPKVGDRKLNALGLQLLVLKVEAQKFFAMAIIFWHQKNITNVGLHSIFWHKMFVTLLLKKEIWFEHKLVDKT